MWAWHYDGMINDSTGRYSKHIYLNESRIVTKIARADGSFTNEERIKQYYYHSDHLGSAQLISNADGEEYERIEYTPYGELWIEKASTASNIDIPFRFTGKERDEETGLYYYGARYLDSKTSRWLSADPALGDYIPGAPVNDETRKRNSNLPGMGGVFNTVNSHLYHYAGNNPVKYTDPDGNAINFVIGAAIGFVSSTAIEVGGRMATGQSFGTAMKNTFTDTTSLAVIGASTAIGAVTSGVSGLAVSVATKGATSVSQVAVTTIAINTASGAVDAAAKDVAVKAITGQPQNIKETASVAGKGALLAAGFSTVTQGAIAAQSTKVTTAFSNNYGVKAGTQIVQPDWAGSAGVMGESIIPTAIDTGKIINKQFEDNK
jgi:RHS repeat-associated protein